MPTDVPEDHSFEAGYLVGLLAGEGHFGGDGRQPQVTLRMHVRHRAIFEWLTEHVAAGRLYGPYEHSGRAYYQWICRGEPLRTRLVPFLSRHLAPDLDGPAFERFEAMCERYAIGRG
jgi:hypothetical protein